MRDAFVWVEQSALGEFMTELQEYATFNREFADAMRAAKKGGKSVEEVVKTWKQDPKYQGYAEVQEARLRSNAQVIFDEIK